MKSHSYIGDFVFPNLHIEQRYATVSYLFHGHWGIISEVVAAFSACWLKAKLI